MLTDNLERRRSGIVISVNVSYLNNSFEGLVALLIGSGLLKVPADSDVFSQENFAVILKPVQDLKNRK